MHFYSTMSILFIILFQMKGIYSTQEVCSENDITIHLNEWVSAIFTKGHKRGTKIIYAIYDCRLKQFEYNISNQETDLNKKIFFQEITFGANPLIEYTNKKAQQIHWKFAENKIIVSFEELYFRVEIRARSRAENGDKFEDVATYPKFKNFTLTVVKSHTKEDQITYDFTHSGIDDWEDTFWHTVGNLTLEEKDQINRLIKPTLPTILRENLNTNTKLIYELDDLFQSYDNPRKKLSSTHTDFSNNPQKYYYLIAEIPFFNFVLKHVVIYGLWNFESYKVHATHGIFTHTMLVRNIEGTMTLDYGSEKEPPLELNFHINCFILSKQDDTECVYGQAKYYTVTRTRTNVLLSSLQSEVVINQLESALASALLSSKKVGKICDVEMPLEKLKISNTSDWKSIKEFYNGWIPFNDDEVIKK
ncbi:uncharacterized protein LOC135837313 [Planococcus citri]|uniref:uncharacterized protein LOC135837313 n=1 Tax=Planococcus citri TaxID=170843 RepID=UPI0031F914D3